MTWYLYQWTFQLKSPLHIGFHKVMHFFRTRPYVPAKLLWGALTAKLTPILGTCDYQRVGNFIKKAMHFSYLYPYVDGKLYLPKYTENGFMFGSLAFNKFEKKFISSMASTAIEAESLTAEEGMFHEIEFISPFTIDNGESVFMKGLLWIREFSENGIRLYKRDDNIHIKNDTSEVRLKEDVLNRLQMGGEQKYGFGLLELEELIKSDNLTEFCGRWEDGNELKLKLNSNDPIWSHVLHGGGVNIKGNIEPLIGRDWDTDKGAGKKLTYHGLCWTPGSILITDTTFRIIDFGLWEVSP